jgi:hypothetical protein
MLVLGDAGKGDVLVAIVEHGRTLEIAFATESLKIQRAIAKPAKLVIEIAVDRTAVYPDSLRRRKNRLPSCEKSIRLGA